jgi:tetratricopeptide (TPR) repeat protein
MFALRRSIWCLFGLLLATSSPARADDPAKQARALFEQGLSQADAAHWTEAADLFQRALALRDSPVIRFNLSSALAELGKLTEALTLLQALALDGRTSRELLQRVTHDREALQKRLANLTIRVETDATDYRVLLDEQWLPPEKLNVALKLDPKLHSLSLRAGELVLDDEQVELKEGETRELLLEGKVPPPVVAKPPPLQISLVGFGEQRHDDGMSKRKKRVIWGVSVAAAAVAAGVVAGVMLAKKDDGPSASADAFSPGRIAVRVPQ